MSEVLIDLRRNVVPISVKVVVLALFFLIVATVASFATSVSSAISSSFSEETEVDLFGVVDTLTDPDAFYAFRQSTRSIQQLGAFYDGLNTSDDLTLLSAFDQQIPVQDFRGGDEFDPGYGNELSLTDEYVDATSGSVVEDVRAMQMNRQALEFYDIEVASGTSIDWGTVDYPGGKVPVLLGSAYEGVYQVGERLSGSLYLRPMEFEVVGILRQGSAMFYKGEMNTYLDSAMIVPYPESLTEIGSLDQEFLGILSFAMINADVASGGGTGFDGVADELRQISMRTGFEDYSLIGVPTYLIQFGLMRQLIVDNRGLLVVVLALLAGGVACAGTFVSLHLRARRRPAASVLWTLGWSFPRIVRLQRRLWMVEYVAVGALFALGLPLLPGVGPGAFLATLALMVVWFVVDGLVQHRLLVGAVFAVPGGRS